MSAITYAPRIPLHSLGYGRADVKTFHTHRVRAPRIPLHSLGYLGTEAQAIQAGGAIGGKVAGSITTTAATSAGWGAWAGPIGAAVAVGVGLIAGLLAAHAQRVKQAKDENSAVNLGVSGFDSDLKKIQQAFALGQVDVPTAIQAAQLILQNYWQLVAPHIQPGRNGCRGGAACSNAPCSGSIGAACCVGCGALNLSINGPNGAIAAINGTSGRPEGPHVAEIQKVFPSSYGTHQRDPYELTFTPPAASLSASSAVSSIESALGGGSSSMLPLLLVGAAAFFLLR